MSHTTFDIFLCYLLCTLGTSCQAVLFIISFIIRFPILRQTRYSCHGCQMAIAGFLDRMCLALRASGLWFRYAALQNLIPSFPWIAPPRPPPWRNPRKGRDQILPSGNHDSCNKKNGTQDLIAEVQNNGT